MQSFSVFGLGICLMALSLNNYFCVLGFPGTRKIQHGHRHQEQQQISCGPGDWYHKETEKCYSMNQGPCGVNMVFAADRRNPGHGVCQCVDHIGCQYWPFTYWPAEQRCYRLFERGPCNENEWLVDHNNNNRDLDRDRSHRKNEGDGGERSIHGVCRMVPRDCHSHPPSSSAMKFSQKGKCYNIGTKGFCKNPDHKMHFTQGSSQPRCSSQRDQVTSADGCSNGPIFSNQPNNSPIFVPPPPPSILPNGPGPVLAPEDIRNGGGELLPQKLIIIPPPSSSSTGPMIVSPPPGPTLTLEIASPSPPPTVVSPTSKTISAGNLLPCPKGSSGATGGSCLKFAEI